MMQPATTIRTCLALLVALSCIFAAVFSSPIDSLHPHFVDDLSELVDARAENVGNFKIRGVQDGSIQVRQEIRQFASDSDLLNLFLLSLESFQAMNQNDTLSYYQVAGIHGVPYVSWDGGFGPRPNPTDGYCAHYSNIFLPWHRPYVALFEQLLYGIIQSIAASFPQSDQRDRYVAVAKKFRLPYWDWVMKASGSSNLPDIMSTPTVSVQRPNGTSQTIKNPLYSYSFHPLDSSALYDNWQDYMSSFPETLRCPTSKTVGATSQQDLARSSLDYWADNYRQRVYTLMWNYTDFMKFGNALSVTNTDWQIDDSIETVHGWPHVALGGDYGHMTYPPWSAFDPAFWLHHCQMDRLFALWQALHPNSYVTPQAQAYGTFAYSGGTTLDEHSALYPFHNGTGTYWDSASVRNHRVFGYTYAEVELANLSSIRAAINSQYGPDPPRTSVRNLKAVGRAEAFSTLQNYYDYVVNVRVDQQAVGSAFVVYFFLGNFNADPTTWDTEPALAGTNAVFALPVPPGFGSRPLVGGVVPLTKKLQQLWVDGAIEDLSPPVVVSYLKTNLHWRVSKVDKAEVPISDIPSLKISVASSLIHPGQTNDAFPTQIGFTEVHPEVTDGVAGGLTTAEAASGS